MERVNAIDVLNRLYVVHNRSLPMYLGYANAPALRGEEGAKELLGSIVADQQDFVERIGALVLDSGNRVAAGEFPMAFTGYHDLSYEFLVGKMIEHQKHDLATIQKCVEQLNPSPVAKALAEECLGAAKGHLDSLEELPPPASSSE